MISQLNHNSNSWTRIFKIDMSGNHPDLEQDEEGYFAVQLDLIVTKQFENGFYLKGITFFQGNWILVFQPERRRD